MTDLFDLATRHPRFRGLWRGRRDGVVYWTVTYLEAADFVETQEWPTAWEACNDFLERAR